MKTNNIIVGVLVAVVAVMGVAFAAFSTTLTINGTATISSNWKIEYTAGNCTITDSAYVSSTDQTKISRGTVSVDGSGLVTVTTHMVSPGDELTCNITVTNKSTGLNAIRSQWRITTAVSNATAYTVNVTSDPATAAALAPNGSETLSVVVKYNDIENDDKPTADATFHAQAVYEQALGA